MSHGGGESVFLEARLQVSHGDRESMILKAWLQVSHIDGQSVILEARLQVSHGNTQTRGVPATTAERWWLRKDTQIQQNKRRGSR